MVGARSCKAKSVGRWLTRSTIAYPQRHDITGISLLTSFHEVVPSAPSQGFNLLHEHGKRVRFGEKYRTGRKLSALIHLSRSPYGYPNASHSHRA